MLKQSSGAAVLFNVAASSQLLRHAETLQPRVVAVCPHLHQDVK